MLVYMYRKHYGVFQSLGDGVILVKVILPSKSRYLAMTAIPVDFQDFGFLHPSALILGHLLEDFELRTFSVQHTMDFLGHIDELPGMQGDPDLPEVEVSEQEPAVPRIWPSAHPNDTKSKYGHRDLVGYGRTTPNPQWPHGAKVALNFVINYEEGGESCILHGDTQSEHLLSDIPGAQPMIGERNPNMESMYDYGSRCGFWRLHRLFTSRKVPVTVFAVGMALERNIQATGAMKEAEWEVASHGYRWLDYSNVDEDTEREHIARTIEIHKNLLGRRPYGIYQGKPNLNTRKHVVEEGGFLYDSDSYADDLPYWTMEYANGRPHLVIPYTLTENDMAFTSGNGWSEPGDFCRHLKSTLDSLVAEGKSGYPKMMSVGLHCRLARPGRVAALQEFLDYAKSYGSTVWICTREQIANHWYDKHLPRGSGTPIVEAEKLRSGSSFPHDAGFGGSSSRFSFLGNLTVPRDLANSASSPDVGAADSDGDII